MKCDTHPIAIDDAFRNNFLDVLLIKMPQKKPSVRFGFSHKDD